MSQVQQSQIFYFTYFYSRYFTVYLYILLISQEEPPNRINIFCPSVCFISLLKIISTKFFFRVSSVDYLSSCEVLCLIRSTSSTETSAQWNVHVDLFSGTHTHTSFWSLSLHTILPTGWKFRWKKIRCDLENNSKRIVTPEQETPLWCLQAPGTMQLAYQKCCTTRWGASEIQFYPSSVIVNSDLEPIHPMSVFTYMITVLASFQFLSNSPLAIMCCSVM